MPFVTVVSGTSGGGKTTLIGQLVDLMPGETLRLHFDDYVNLGNDPGTIITWLEGGADPNEIETPQLATDLEHLRAGRAIEHPDDASIVKPASIILVEEPFGRSRREIAPLVDWAVHLELPADIALARRLVRAIDESEKERHASVLQDIHHDLRAYLAAGRKAYTAAEAAARGNADLVLDGLKSAEDIALDLVKEIRRRVKTRGL